MTVVKQNFTVWAGDDYSIVVIVSDASGNPYDLTGASIEWALSQLPTSNALLTKSTATGAGITISSPPSLGQFTIQLNSADTLDVPGSCYHEARITDSSNKSRVAMTGTATINPSNL